MFIIPVCRYVVISKFSNTEVLVHKCAELCMFCNAVRALFTIMYVIYNYVCYLQLCMLFIIMYVIYNYVCHL